jgi:hypothetical protein
VRSTAVHARLESAATSAYRFPLALPAFRIRDRNHLPPAAFHSPTWSLGLPIPPVRSSLPAFIRGLNPRFPPLRFHPFRGFRSALFHAGLRLSLRCRSPSGLSSLRIQPPACSCELPCGALLFRRTWRPVQALSKRLAFRNRSRLSLPAKPVFKADHRSLRSRPLWLTVPSSPPALRAPSRSASRQRDLPVTASTRSAAPARSAGVKPEPRGGLSLTHRELTRCRKPQMGSTILPYLFGPMTPCP